MLNVISQEQNVAHEMLNEWLVTRKPLEKSYIIDMYRSLRAVELCL